MPTVALYVPAHVFRLLGSDPERVREVARAAVEVAAGLGAGVSGSEDASPVRERSVAATPGADPAPAPSPVLPTTVREFRPDPKKGK